MSNEQNPNQVADNLVVSLIYSLIVNGEVLDSSGEDDPLEFLQGFGEIIPGLERELYGMKIGETKKVHVKSAEGYGAVDPDAFVEVPLDQLPPDMPLEIGTEIQVRDMDGEILDARISKVEENTVVLDFNHPLAGKDLDFDVKIGDLRAPTAEELEHGHAHGEDDDEDEYYEEDYDEDDEELIEEDEDEEEKK